MDGENNGSNPMNKWDDLGGFTTPIFGNIHVAAAENGDFSWSHAAVFAGGSTVSDKIWLSQSDPGPVDRRGEATTP